MFKLLENTAKAREHRQPLDNLCNYIMPGWGIENNLSSVMVIGAQGSGKTTYVNNLIPLAAERRNIDPSEVLIVHGFSQPLLALFHAARAADLSAIKHLILINDDAAAGRGQLSRRSMSKENAALAQFYIVIRHEAKRLGYARSICAFHITQVYSLIDKALRANCIVKIWKNYPESQNDKYELIYELSPDGINMLKQLDRKLWTAENDTEKYDALSSAVVKISSFAPFLLKLKPRQSKIRTITVTSTAEKKAQNKTLEGWTA